MTRTKRIVTRVFGAGVALLLYALADIVICNMIHSTSSGSSWQAVSCLVATGTGLACIASLIPLTLLLDRRPAVAASAAPAPAIPKPDWAAIYRMELDLYGETFEHEGAPVAVAPKLREARPPKAPMRSVSFAEASRNMSENLAAMAAHSVSMTDIEGPLNAAMAAISRAVQDLDN